MNKAMDDLYYREEKNPAKKKSGWDIVMKILLPIIVAGLIALLVFQIITLSKLDGQVVAEAPSANDSSVVEAADTQTANTPEVNE